MFFQERPISNRQALWIQGLMQLTKWLRKKNKFWNQKINNMNQMTLTKIKYTENALHIRIEEELQSTEWSKRMMSFTKNSKRNQGPREPLDS